MPKVLVTPEFYKLPEAPTRYRKLLESAGFEVVYPERDVVSQDVEARVKQLESISAVIASVEPYPRQLLEATSLRVIARHGVGHDGIDLVAASECDIVVTVAAGANYEAVAEHTIAMVLGIVHGFPFRDQQIRHGQWSRKPLPPGRGRILGLVGLGGVGRAVVPLAKALKMEVVATDPMADEQFAESHGVGLLGLEELLAVADIVSLHVPSNRHTIGMFDARMIGQMKPGAVLVNTARGNLVDEDALVDALERGNLAGAALDVFQEEPLPEGHPLTRLPNVLLSPHIAGGDTESLESMSTLAAESIIYLHAGAWPEGRVVNPEVRRNWRWHRDEARPE